MANTRKTLKGNARSQSRTAKRSVSPSPPPAKKSARGANKVSVSPIG